MLKVMYAFSIIFPSVLAMGERRDMSVGSSLVTFFV